MALQVAFSPSASSSCSSSSSSSSSPPSSFSASSRLACPGRASPAMEVRLQILSSSASPPSFSSSARSRSGRPGRKVAGAPLTIARAVEQAHVGTEQAGGVMEVTQENFWAVVAEAADRLVVLDMYTQWCGPCKLMYPKLVELSAKHSDVLFLKLDCNQENKALAKSLGIKVVPTFKLFKKGKEIAEVKGAKFDELVQKIEAAKAADS